MDRDSPERLIAFGDGPGEPAHTGVVSAVAPDGALKLIMTTSFGEGLSVQIMHIGPYEAEGPTIARMYGFIAENGYEPAGKHHEIYLSDPR